MDNDFGWKRLPKSFMNENAVFMLLTAMIGQVHITIIMSIKSFYVIIMD